MVQVEENQQQYIRNDMNKEKSPKWGKILRFWSKKSKSYLCSLFQSYKWIAKYQSNFTCKWRGQVLWTVFWLKWKIFVLMNTNSVILNYGLMWSTHVCNINSCTVFIRVLTVSFTVKIIFFPSRLCQIDFCCHCPLEKKYPAYEKVNKTGLIRMSIGAKNIGVLIVADN